jgi:alpha-beta hydrolase superfamily lysophospholipase
MSMQPKGNGLSFAEILIDYSAIPPLKTYAARDGASLPYRYYPARSNKTLILLHCSSWHSRYFMPLAMSLSAADAAQVYTPDLRGHGLNPARRGDVDYIGQYEDDLADLIALIRKENPEAQIIIGGHSSGGGLAIRFGGGKYGSLASAYILLAPYLHFLAPTFRFDVDWAAPNIKLLLGLIALNALGVRRFNHLPVMSLNVPLEARDGAETLLYSYRLFESYSPRNYPRDLMRIKQPLLLVAGTKDESFIAERYARVFSRYPNAQVNLLEDASHMGLVMKPQLAETLATWLRAL